MAEEDARMIRDNRLNELQSKCLLQSRETQEFGPLVLCQETQVVEYLKLLVTKPDAYLGR